MVGVEGEVAAPADLLGQVRIAGQHRAALARRHGLGGVERDDLGRALRPDRATVGGHRAEAGGGVHQQRDPGVGAGRLPGIAHVGRRRRPEARQRHHGRDVAAPPLEGVGQDVGVEVPVIGGDVDEDRSQAVPDDRLCRRRERERRDEHLRRPARAAAAERGEGDLQAAGGARHGHGRRARRRAQPIAQQLPARPEVGVPAAGPRERQVALDRGSARQRRPLEAKGALGRRTSRRHRDIVADPSGVSGSRLPPRSGLAGRVEREPPDGPARRGAARRVRRVGARGCRTGRRGRGW